MTPQLSPEALYAHWKAIIEEAPVRWERQRRSPEVQRWLGKVAALCEIADPISSDLAALRVAISALANNGAIEIDRATHTIWSIVYRQLAKAELLAPSVKGAFIPAHSPFDALAAITTLFGQATTTILIVDPYLGGEAVVKFLPAVLANVSIRLLTDSHGLKPTLMSAVDAWRQQYGSARPLDLRVSLPRALHDRVVIIDQLNVFLLTQSLNAFAARSPASIAKAEPELASLKVAAYDAVWLAATAL